MLDETQDRIVEPIHDSKKKLLIATDNFLPRWDGIARFLSEIIPRLAAHYEITVIAPDCGTYEDPNIKLIKIPDKTFQSRRFSHTIDKDFNHQ
jgi:hypothetical protein